MDSSTDDKFKPGQPSTPFVPQGGGATTHEMASPIENLASAAGNKAKEYQGKTEKAWDDAQDRVRTFQKDGERYVRQNPIKAIASALGIGLVLGLIFRRH